ncbi:hypothetical protein F4823DRAFT_570294 [Ustulina deusta]|nr:hypothetical protein F4823DRAFT_570294 [Ustulina deusta]
MIVMRRRVSFVALATISRGHPFIQCHESALGYGTSRRPSLAIRLTQHMFEFVQMDVLASLFRMQLNPACR